MYYDKEQRYLEAIASGDITCSEAQRTLATEVLAQDKRVRLNFFTAGLIPRSIREAKLVDLLQKFRHTYGPAIAAYRDTSPDA